MLAGRAEGDQHMTVQSYGLFIRGYIYTYPASGGPASSEPYTQEASAEAIGGGVFLTAAHPFDEFFSTNKEFKYETAGLTGFVDQGGSSANSLRYLGSYDPTTLGPNDLAVVAASSVAGPSGGLTPIVAFADSAAADKFFSKTSSMVLASATTNNGAQGTYSAILDGGFLSSLETQDGDSGGAAVVHPSGQSSDYIAGIVSSSQGPQQATAPTGPTKFSYLSTQAYDQLIAATPVGTDFGGVTDLLIGSQSTEVIRGSRRKADIITNGAGDVILAGGNGDLINTETGQNDVVFMPSAVGQTNPGTTVVLSPGTKTIVGGSASDRLVIPTDRLWSKSGGVPDMPATSNSDTLQLLGGWGNEIGSVAGDGNNETDRYYYFESSYAVTTGNENSTDPSVWEAGDYAYGATYHTQLQSDGTTDLTVGYYAPDDSGFKPSLWTGSVLIKDFTPGDFGLTFTSSSAFGEELSGRVTADQFYSEQAAAMTSLTSSSAGQIGIDDDQSITWNGQNTTLVADSDIAGPSASELASDFAMVTGDTEPLQKAPPSQPSPCAIGGTSAGQFTAAEAPIMPFAIVSISDGNAGATDTLTIALMGAGGTLSGVGLTKNAAGIYTLAAASPTTLTGEVDALGCVDKGWQPQFHGCQCDEGCEG